MQIVRVQTPSARYQVFTGTGLIDALEPRMVRVLGRALPQRVFVLTSPEIWALWSRRFLTSFSVEPIVLFLAAQLRVGAAVLAAVAGIDDDGLECLARVLHRRAAREQKKRERE